MIKKSVPIKFKCFPCFWFVLFVSIDIKGCPNRRDQHKDLIYDLTVRFYINKYLDCQNVDNKILPLLIY